MNGTAQRTAVLFVDDEARILDGMRRMLRGVRDEWDMEFANGGQAALHQMKARRFDVVVSDMRMPGMDGAELLTHVKGSYPDVVRLILSGHADTQSVMRAVGAAHQYLSKPCDAGILKTTVARALALKSLLSDERLTRFVGQVDTLPSMPSSYRDLLACLQSPNASLVDAARIVARDPAMTVKVLQLVNSAYFGLARQVNSVDRAVNYLGLDTLKSLVLVHGIFSECKLSAVPGVSLERLWSRGLNVAAAARLLAKHAGLDARAQDDAFLAGILQDIGTLLLVGEMPGQYGETLVHFHQGGVTRAAAETAVFGASHAEIGAYLIGLWGLPDQIVEAVAFHELPSAGPSPGLSLAGIVHVAERLIDNPGDSTATPPPDIDSAWLASLGKPGAWNDFAAAWAGAGVVETLSCPDPGLTSTVFRS